MKNIQPIFSTFIFFNKNIKYINNNNILRKTIKSNTFMFKISNTDYEFIFTIKEHVT